VTASTAGTGGGTTSRSGRGSNVGCTTMTVDGRQVGVIRILVVRPDDVFIFFLGLVDDEMVASTVVRL
jgi:hypothetical protein